MPELNLKVTPVFGESRYSYTLIHDFLEARIRDEIKVSVARRSIDLIECFPSSLASARFSLDG